MIKGIIFDLDGTLLDSMWVWHEVDRRFLERRGIPLTKDYQQALLNLHFDTAATYTIERYHLTQTPEEVMAEWLDLAKNMYNHEVQLKPDAYAYLKELHEKNISIAIATSCLKELYFRCLERYGIHDWFDMIVETGELGYAKDNPLVYQTILDHWQIQPQECLVYEDVLMAVNTAKKLGCQVIAILDNASMNHWEEIKEIADDSINDFTQAKRL